MTNKKVTEVIELVDHPLEDFFGVEPGSTEVVKYEQKTELVKVEEYDAKDNEIEENFQEIQDKAMNAYENLAESIEDIEPKYASRAYEVCNQLLNTALAAADKKADLKKHKDKISVARNKTGTKTQNNTIIIDTNSLIEQLKSGKMPDAIDVTPEVTEDDTDVDEEE